MRARDIMTTPVISVDVSTPLKEIATLLVGHQISAVPVLDSEGRVVGLVSEADILPLEATPELRGRLIHPVRKRGPLPRIAADVMVLNVVAVTEDDDVGDVARIMLRENVKRVPVLSGDNLTGIISRRDILKVFVRPDPDINEEVQGILDREVRLLGTFRATVIDGEVFLEGPADRASRRVVEVLLRSVPGVVAVRFGKPEPAVYHYSDWG